MKKKRSYAVLALIVCLLLGGGIWRAMDLAKRHTQQRDETIFYAADALFWLSGNGELYGAGDNRYMRIQASPWTFCPPTLLMEHVSAVYPGGTVVLALCSDGSLWGWGNEVDGLLLQQGQSGGHAVKLLDDVACAAIGSFHCAAVRTDGTLLVWGRNQNGQLGLGYADNTITAEPLSPLPGHSFSSVYAVDDLTFAIDVQGDLYVWGHDDQTGTCFLSPTLVASNAADANRMADGVYLVKRKDGSLLCLDLAGSSTEELEPAGNGVIKLCDYGYLDTDGCFWLWTAEGGQVNAAKDVYAAQGYRDGTCVIVGQNSIQKYNADGKRAWTLPLWLFP